MHLLDANTFIEAKNLYYPFEVAPGYWDWLLSAHDHGVLASVVAVRAELLAQGDELAAWARRTPATFWVEESSGTVAALRTLAAWADSPTLRYRPAARAEFLAAADFRLIGEALGGGHTVVTREASAPDSLNDIKIPDVCTAHRLPCIDPFRLYRTAGLRLVRPGMQQPLPPEGAQAA